MGLISRVSSRTYRKTMGNKPRGIKCARKLRNNRRLQRWADLDYKKAHLGTTLKANPFGGSSHAKGIVVEKNRSRSQTAQLSHSKMCQGSTHQKRKKDHS